MTPIKNEEHLNELAREGTPVNKPHWFKPPFTAATAGVGANWVINARNISVARTTDYTTAKGIADGLNLLHKLAKPWGEPATTTEEN